MHESGRSEIVSDNPIARSSSFSTPHLIVAGQQ